MDESGKANSVCESFNIKYQFVNHVKMGNAVLPSTKEPYFHDNQIHSLNNVHIACDFDSFTVSKIYTWNVQR